jgi:spoIIIJ-associated protein
MEWVETTGRSVDEAKDAALDQLGVDEQDAEFVVVSEPRAGLFGRTRGEARVRARVVPASPRPKRGRSRRQPGQTRSPRRSQGTGSGRRAGKAALLTADRQGTDEGYLEEEDAEGAGEQVLTADAGGTRDSRQTLRKSQRPPRRRSRGGRSGQGDDLTGAADDDRSSAGSRRGPGEGAEHQDGRPGGPGAAKEETVGEELSLEEQGESAREFVDGLAGLLGLHPTVTMAVLDEETAQVSVDGTGLGILVGPGGGTLAALQELARAVVQRRTGGQSNRILVDVAGYRAKRATALQRFARQIAEEVVSSSTERALEPMSAADRKIVHDTVNEIEGVATRSMGDEPRRYIVIAPVVEDSAAVGAEDA